MNHFIIERKNNKFSPFYSEFLRDLRAMMLSLGGDQKPTRIVLIPSYPVNEQPTSAGVSWFTEAGPWVENNAKFFEDNGITTTILNDPEPLVENLKLLREKNEGSPMIIVVNEGQVDALIEASGYLPEGYQEVQMVNYVRHYVR
jgi:hypothetical protein